MKINNRYLQFALFLAAFIVVWNLCDLVAATFIYHGAYHFSFADDIARPAGFGLLIGIVLYLLPGRNK